MKILYVAPRYLPHAGGVETHLSHLAAIVASRGHEVVVIAQESDLALSAVAEIEGVLVRRFPIMTPRGTYPFAPGVWRYLARESGRFDLVHAHNYHAFSAIGAGLLGRTPLVITPHYHGPGHTRLGSVLHRPYRLVGGRMMRRARTVICVSESEARLVRSHFPDVSPRLSVIPNGVDIIALQGAEPYPVPGRVVLTVGRLLRYKNIHRVIDALTLLPAEYELHIVGTGPDEHALRTEATQRGIANRVSFQGQVSDEELRRWYRTAAVYTALSEQEAFGLTPIEALAAGTPVVASDIAAHREAIGGTHGATLIPLGAPTPEVAAAIQQAATQGGRAAVPETAISWEEVAERTIEVYEVAI